MVHGTPDYRMGAVERPHIREVLRALVHEIAEGGIGLTYLPPGPATSRIYGDVVPAGLLLRALRAYEPAGSTAVASLQRFLADRRQGLLWPYHTGGLITSVDSGLVLLGWSDPAAVEALEQFRDARGGYVAQHCAERPQPDAMQVTDRSRHWCRPDYSVGLLVAALRHEHGLPPITDSAPLRAGFDGRSGLFFANPYLVDWLLALALRGTPDADLSRRLAGEILSGMSADGSFGVYDSHLSTALAILALSALGVPASALRQSQERLISFMGADGRWPPATPFYSALRVDEARLPVRFLFDLALSGRNGQFIRLQEASYAVSLYHDGPGIITTSLAALALTVSPQQASTLSAGSLELSSPHRRYRCSDPVAYVAEVALPPYVG